MVFCRFNALLIMHLIKRLAEVCMRVASKPGILLPALIEDNMVRHWQFVYHVLELPELCKENLIIRWVRFITRVDLCTDTGSPLSTHVFCFFFRLDSSN